MLVAAMGVRFPADVVHVSQGGPVSVEGKAPLNIEYVDAQVRREKERERERACVRACVCACVRVYTYIYMCVCVYIYSVAAEHQVLGCAGRVCVQSRKRAGRWRAGVCNPEFTCFTSTNYTHADANAPADAAGSCMWTETWSTPLLVRQYTY